MNECLTKYYLLYVHIDSKMSTPKDLRCWVKSLKKINLTLNVHLLYHFYDFLHAHTPFTPP